MSVLPAFSRRDGARWTRAATTTTARAFARVELTRGGTHDVTRQRDGHGQCRRAPSFSEDPGFASCWCEGRSCGTHALVVAFPLRVRPPLPPRRTARRAMEKLRALPRPRARVRSCAWRPRRTTRARRWRRRGDGAAVVFDLRGDSLVAHRLSADAGCFSAGDAVTSVAYARAREHLLFCASGCAVTAWDLRAVPVARAGVPAPDPADADAAAAAVARASIADPTTPPRPRAVPRTATPSTTTKSTPSPSPARRRLRGGRQRRRRRRRRLPPRGLRRKARQATRRTKTHSSGAVFRHTNHGTS